MKQLKALCPVSLIERVCGVCVGSGVVRSTSRHPLLIWCFEKRTWEF